MLKFDIRKQPNIKELNEKLVNKLVEEANEVKEAYYNEDIGVDDYIQEILDVQQVLFALYATYVDANTFGIFEHNIKAHNNKLANSHKDRYSLGDIEYYGYINLMKPAEPTTGETLERENKYLKAKVKGLENYIEKQDKELNKLRIENGEYREMYSNIEKYLQELKANK